VRDPFPASAARARVVVASLSLQRYAKPKVLWEIVAEAVA
jgi:hypothetical protein